MKKTLLGLSVIGSLMAGPPLRKTLRPFATVSLPGT